MTFQAGPKPFLESQSCRLLLDREDPLRHLTLAGVRGTPSRGFAPLQSSGSNLGEPSAWWGMDRSNLLDRRIEAPRFPFVDTDGNQIDGAPRHDMSLKKDDYPGNRIVLTGDGGTGKSVNLTWLWSQTNRSWSPRQDVDSASVAFRMNLYELPHVRTSFITDVLIPQVRKVAARLTRYGSQATIDRSSDPNVEYRRQRFRTLAEQLRTEAASDKRLFGWLDSLRRRGWIELYFDGLDQVAGSTHALGILDGLLNGVDWHRCRIVLAARPHAIRRQWDRIFASDAKLWTFVALDEFDEQQQRVLLGRKYDLIPIEGRTLLTNPRALDYVRQLDDDELDDLRTPSDVYDRATWHMLKEGMRASDRAKRLGLHPGEATPDNVQRRSMERARRLLAAIAFEMTSQQIPAANGGANQPTREVPNFEQVRAGSEFDQFCQRVRHRLEMDGTESDRRLFEFDLDALAALNDHIQQGFLDTDAQDLEGLDQILWRDRTLQEYYTALHMTRWSTQDDAKLIDDWLYLPNSPDTEEYYMVWRFATEMPARSRAPESWVRVMRPIYSPGTGDKESTQRSNEMLYRSWRTMEDYAALRLGNADEVQNAYLAEFQSILDGKQGKERRRLAKQFQSLFRKVDRGPFQMGTPGGKQGMPDDDRAYWAGRLRDATQDPDEFAREFAVDWTFPPGKRGEHQRERVLNDLRNIVIEYGNGASLGLTDRENRGLLDFENWFFPPNETPHESWKADIGPFLLQRYPTLSGWYRLFDTGHGLRGEWFTSNLNRVSESDDHPVIFVSWYDAWAFCKWAHWEGKSCRLPHEDEWEKAAKDGTPWDWRYWWGDEFEDGQERCTANQPLQTGTTTKPMDFDIEHATCLCDHTNPWGFVDMLGNVWEWTEDEYRRAYSRDVKANSASRVCRGGSWYDAPWYVRSAVRYDVLPTDLSGSLGFRVARAL